jgi:hypothetical protein
VGLGNALIRSGRSRVDLSGAFHVESLVRTFIIEILDESIELCLLLEDVGASGAGGFLFQSEMHAFVAAVLLRMAGSDALNGDAQPQAPYRKLRELKQSMRRGEGNAVIRADAVGQTTLSEKALKGLESKLFAIGFQRFTQQQKPGGVIGDGQGVAITFVAELELALVIGRPTGYQSAWNLDGFTNGPCPLVRYVPISGNAFPIAKQIPGMSGCQKVSAF